MISDKEKNVLFPNGVNSTWKTILHDSTTLTKIYYKDAKIYGIIAITPFNENLLIVNSGTINNQPFTLGMNRSIRRLCQKNNIALSSIMKDSSITRYGEYDEATKSFYIKKRI